MCKHGKVELVRCYLQHHAMRLVEAKAVLILQTFKAEGLFETAAICNGVFH
jgi:hypothetical protein